MKKSLLAFYKFGTKVCKSNWLKWRVQSTTIIATLLLAVVLSSCQYNSVPETESIKESIVYFKDNKTKLCFAAINSTNTSSLSNSSSITCVPCDSLKNVDVK